MKIKCALVGVLSATVLFGGVVATVPLGQSQTAQAVSATYKEGVVSFVGQLKTVNSRIYMAPGSKSSVKASTKYIDEIFYVSKKSTASTGEVYYLVSRQLDVRMAAVGWVRASSVKLAAYETLKNTKKTWYIKGMGKAYSRPGGLARNVILSNLSTYKNKEFVNNMTVKIGKVTWYRATVNSQTLWLPSTSLVAKKPAVVAVPVKSKTSKLVRVKSKTVRLLVDVVTAKTNQNLGDLTGETFYVGEQLTFNKVTYVALQRNNKVIGWAKLSDLTVKDYVAPSNFKKIMYVKGVGSGYVLPWGSTKNLVSKDLTALKEEKFMVTKQAKVGSSTWYYGSVVGGQAMWVTASALMSVAPKPADPVITATSKLARLINESVVIRADVTDAKTEKKAASLSESTFEVMKQAVYDGENYYHLMQNNKEIGWVKMVDTVVNAYTAPTAYEKTLYHKGTNAGYSLPWGSVNELLVKTTTAWKEQAFIVTKQAKVGSTTWYYGAVDKGEKVWVAASATTTVAPTIPVQDEITYSTQTLQGVAKATAVLYKNVTTLATKTLTTNEKTEKFTINRSAKKGDQTYYELTRLSTAGKNTVVGWMLSKDITTAKITASVKESSILYLTGLGNATNIAGGTAAGNLVFKDLASYPATKFTATASQKIGAITYYLGKVNGKTVWVSEANFGNPYRYFNLRKVSDITQEEMENYLVLKKKDPIKTNNLYKAIPVFLDMQTKYGINAQFMLAHAIWETGWGGSAISQYKNNFFGYQAFDSCAMTCSMYFPTGTDGIQYYADAIYRKYLREGAIYNNGVSAAGMNVKYATDKNWAINIARLMEEMKPYNSTYYDATRTSTVDPELPAFNYSNIIPTGKPIPETYRTFDTGITANITLTTAARKLPYATAGILKNYTAGTKLTLDGTNDDVSSKWIRIRINKEEAWLSRSVLKIDNLGQATMEANIRDLPTTTNTKVLATIKKNTFFKLIQDETGKVITQKDANQTIWYNVQIPGKKTTGWISSTIMTVY